MKVSLLKAYKELNESDNVLAEDFLKAIDYLFLVAGITPYNKSIVAILREFDWSKIHDYEGVEADV